MAEFPKNPQRLTPYPNFRFKVKWDGKYVAGVSKVSALSRRTEVAKHRSGGDPSVEHSSPGQTSYEAITLERGVSYDPAFEQWANKVFDVTNSQSAQGQNTSLGDFRKSLTIEVYNEAGQKVLAYNVYDAWVSQYREISDLDSSSNAFVMEELTLENSGWKRDPSVTEQKEPTFTDPAS
ncbi:MAG: phage tail protein [Oceanicaulis sp.]|jgi:phage tail-like protein|nr:phage tail protein [Oceanicaulis sp.]